MVASSDPDLLEEALPVTSWSAPWALLSRLPVLLAEAQGSPTAYRELLRHAHEELKARFLAEEPVEGLVHARAPLDDIVLREVWRAQSIPETAAWALVAVGGYGRGELHPCSDIDIMLLLPKSDSADWQPDIERFLTFLWDIGLEVGHSVRSIDDCQRER